MDLNTFYERIEAHPELEGVLVDACAEGNPGVVIRHKPSHLMTRLPLAAIEAVDDWNALEDVFVGRREPVALQHMTRVVGYFSRVENWNKSKIGELKDRKAGCYSVTDAAN